MSRADTWVAEVRDSDGLRLDGASGVDLELNESGQTIQTRVSLDLGVKPRQSLAFVALLGAPS